MPMKSPKKSKSKLKPVGVAEPEALKIPEQERAVLKNQNQKVTETGNKLEKPNTVKLERTLENAIETLSAGKPKRVTQPRVEKKSNKPKKVISLRDLPVDELYIPLTGPEIDFEEIMRKASPNTRKKVEAAMEKKAGKQQTADEIYIPLHSPPKTEEVEEKLKESQETFKQNFDDGVYIPLHSPPKGSREGLKKVPPPKVPELPRVEKLRKEKQEPKKKEYEVCEDGSIYIPLHSPEEERSARKFEEEIMRVDLELQKARDAAEERLKREEKPESQTLVESGSQMSRLSHGLPSGKSGK